jgi:hypothetical protein
LVGTFGRLWLNIPTPDNAPMSRTTATFSISLPPEMMAMLDDAMRHEHRTRSELIREALRQYFEKQDTRPSHPTLFPDLR